jgi:hypothetical protein
MTVINARHRKRSALDLAQRKNGVLLAVMAARVLAAVKEKRRGNVRDAGHALDLKNERSIQRGVDPENTVEETLARGDTIRGTATGNVVVVVVIANVRENAIGEIVDLEGMKNVAAEEEMRVVPNLWAVKHLRKGVP